MSSRFKKLETLPKQSDLHHWADYAELRCFTDIDGMISIGQLVDMIREGKDKGEAVPDSFGGDEISGDDLDRIREQETIEELGLFDPLDDEDLPDPWSDLEAADPDGDEPSDAERNDRLHGIAADVFARLAWRASAFGSTWPFELKHGSVLSLRDRDAPRNNYLFFLLCSSLRWLPERTANLLSMEFERVCAKVFRQVYPTWEVHLFGTSADPGSRYTGLLFDRLVLLAQDLRCRLKVTKRDFKKGDTGDNGLDIVAWLPMPAGGKGMPLAFAQCACGATNWVGKQSETSEQHWRSTLDLSMPVTNWTFIPFCYHGSGGAWENDRHVNVGVLADRLRICTLLGTDMSVLLPDLPADLAVDLGFTAAA